ncbi:carboxymuconolactone decarboxylase family protein [Kitasatospora sp. NBC_00315]|uniref:carboxymuconolactone decarboxylase family protein n=1 Tax=Kitasatospora sp. NBC_00315 TaxID=2975963 RepID=UPI00324D201B
MPENLFADHDVDTAPAAARRSMEATVKHLGYLPAPVRRLATSPHLLDGFLKINTIFESSTLDPLAREVLVLTMATRNACHVCVAMHTARLNAMGADAGLITALREQRALDDPRLEAVRLFTLEVLRTTGAVGDSAMRSFLDQGFTPQNALEVVLGIGVYTMSTLANRMTQAPTDERLLPFAWHQQPA